MIRVGAQIPNVMLGELSDGRLATAPTSTIFRNRRVVMIGVPGAYTPVCTEKHVPDYVANADLLRASGFDEVCCLAPNDPWVLAKWAAELDPQGKVRFLSDGNLELTRLLGVGVTNTDLFLGSRMERFMMIARDGVVERLVVEANVLLFTCTRAADVVL